MQPIKDSLKRGELTSSINLNQKYEDQYWNYKSKQRKSN